MAELTIRLQIDPATGKKNIIIDLSSDPDALPHEHEQQHRALVDKLIQGGVLKASELGTIIIERDDSKTEPELTQPSPAEPEKQPETPGRS